MPIDLIRRGRALSEPLALLEAAERVGFTFALEGDEVAEWSARPVRYLELLVAPGRGRPTPTRVNANGIEQVGTTLISEHPAWRTTAEGARARLVEHDGAMWLAAWNQRSRHLDLRPVVGNSLAEPPTLAYTSSIELPDTPKRAEPLLDELVRLGTVVRLRNPSLWDSMVTAILRQVVSAKQAVRKHETFYSAYGRRFDTSAGELALAPTPEGVLALSDDEFAIVGAKFNRTALRAAAKAYLDRGEQWASLAPETLVKELVEVPRIGPWTAAAATADYTGDFSVYPHGDLAVRTWARKAAPDLDLPCTDGEFEELWRRWAPSRSQLHALTLFTLTWGSNAVNGHGGQHRP
ncbi:hypothetical protein ABZ990_13000 [Streptomyces sp. NPDC046203]|uniref:hypothetical protein n=1 Tax=Streptomyces sp. NPDC046203 TaxID=3154602 RepID=UPI0033CFB64F